jgi:phosphopantothenoylcysteine decarboxylase/phosphopantothenate--cysteine ligase
LRVKTAVEMLEFVKENLAKTHVFIGCAAVADFRVKNFSPQKIKKTSEENLTLELTKNPDILEFVGRHQNRPKLVIGFAAESEDLEKNAREKLLKKNCDLVVGNSIDEGKIFGNSHSEAIFVEAKKTENLGKISKTDLAKLISKKIYPILVNGK